MSSHAQSDLPIYDVIGVGFGPSNIGLAIALHEKRAQGRRLETLFIEKQPAFTWHRDMLLDNSSMQISFLKDLATLRDPTSRFTFINYLHEKGRLQDFINLKTFFPSRHEFNDYFAWAASHFEDQCRYGEEVFEVVPENRGGMVDLVRVRSRLRNGAVRERLTRNLVLSIGGAANIPEEFAPFWEDGRIFHSNTYLSGVNRNANASKMAVIGAGQSAAEIFLDLHGRPNAPQLDLVMRARAIKPSDDSPFVNQIFDVDFVDQVYRRSQDERNDLLREFRHTNYSGPDMALIEQIYQLLYQQRVVNEERHRFFRQHVVRDVRPAADGVHLDLLDLDTENVTSVRYDAVVLATGYQRQQHKELLAPLTPYLQNFAVSRHYRLKTAPQFQPGIFLQGACEGTHGLSDTLLSVTAARTAEIGEALLAATSSVTRQDAVPA
ncbi:MAG TPA: lysine N(6)-hydroxylase/L-ornithine N(5)-oxygenase family protein [Dongiaceae bacterium]|nr:lysine N(6)-hydroxylase/L-ornithine N(5)-oxygenase family protein [Dongiaceae bacterium]